ncbi:universal stress protein [Jongsikchunia kroppenstedtii]|uniref:universal stress protein n=1 Tax=Jongsikchunia kroppenstedtii TaxID=1121721 RepID=UPI00036DD946|nr:universal stress protein [Jongsikchunia kroppenstedtii]
MSTHAVSSARTPRTEPERPPITVGIDGTDESLAAITWAANEALLRQTTLQMIAAVPSGTSSLAYVGAPPSYFREFIAGARRNVSRAVAHAESTAQEAGIALTTSPTMQTGGPKDVLIDASEQARMIVTGIHLKHRNVLSVVGSTSWELAGYAHCPVVVVKSEPTSHPELIPTVVVGVDGSAIADRALDMAFEEAAVRGARLVVAHAWAGHRHDSAQDPLREPARDADGEPSSAAISAMVAPRQAAYPGLVVEQRFIDGWPADGLAIVSAGADLLVVGCRGRGALRSLTLGSTSLHLLASVDCPLMLVH